MSNKSNTFKKIRAVFAGILCFLLAYEQTGFAQVAASLDFAARLSAPALKPTDTFRPLHLRGLSYDQLNNNFRLFIDKGSIPGQQAPDLNETTKALTRYFLIGVSLPNSSFWVNLRPDAPDNIIAPELAKTDVGKILLEADLQLKKDTAAATSPQTAAGREYWDRLYKKAQELYGTQTLSIPTLIRPWIVPNEIIIRKSQSDAYIYKASLKVMLEQDYLKDSAAYSFPDERAKELNEYAAGLMRELVIPELNKAVNSAKRYAALRQVYYSLILAQWFKQEYRGGQNMYSRLIDSSDLQGLTSMQPWDKNACFDAYKQSFQKGEYDLKEQAGGIYGQTIRTYTSGGIDLQKVSSALTNIPYDPLNNSAAGKNNIIALVSGIPPVIAPGNTAGSSPTALNISAAADYIMQRQGRLNLPKERIVEALMQIEAPALTATIGFRDDPGELASVQARFDAIFKEKISAGEKTLTIVQAGLGSKPEVKESETTGLVKALMRAFEDNVPQQDKGVWAINFLGFDFYEEFTRKAARKFKDEGQLHFSFFPANMTDAGNFAASVKAVLDKTGPADAIITRNNFYGNLETPAGALSKEMLAKNLHSILYAYLSVQNLVKELAQNGTELIMERAFTRWRHNEPVFSFPGIELAQGVSKYDGKYTVKDKQAVINAKLDDFLDAVEASASSALGNSRPGALDPLEMDSTVGTYEDRLQSIISRRNAGSISALQQEQELAMAYYELLRDLALTLTAGDTIVINPFAGRDMYPAVLGKMFPVTNNVSDIAEGKEELKQLLGESEGSSIGKNIIEEGAMDAADISSYRRFSEFSGRRIFIMKGFHTFAGNQARDLARQIINDVLKPGDVILVMHSNDLLSLQNDGLIYHDDDALYAVADREHKLISIKKAQTQYAEEYLYIPDAVSILVKEETGIDTVSSKVINTKGYKSASSALREKTTDSIRGALRYFTSFAQRIRAIFGRKDAAQAITYDASGERETIAKLLGRSRIAELTRSFGVAPFVEMAYYEEKAGIYTMINIIGPENDKKRMEHEALAGIKAKKVEDAILLIKDLLQGGFINIEELNKVIEFSGFDLEKACLSLAELSAVIKREGAQSLIQLVMDDIQSLFRQRILPANDFNFLVANKDLLEEFGARAFHLLALSIRYNLHAIYAGGAATKALAFVRECRQEVKSYGMQVAYAALETAKHPSATSRAELKIISTEQTIENALQIMRRYAPERSFFLDTTLPGSADMLSVFSYQQLFSEFGFENIAALSCGVPVASLKGKLDSLRPLILLLGMDKLVRMEEKYQGSLDKILEANKETWLELLRMQGKITENEVNLTAANLKYFRELSKVLDQQTMAALLVDLLGHEQENPELNFIEDALIKRSGLGTQQADKIISFLSREKLEIKHAMLTRAIAWLIFVSPDAERDRAVFEMLIDTQTDKRMLEALNFMPTCAELVARKLLDASVVETAAASGNFYDNISAVLQAKVEDVFGIKISSINEQAKTSLTDTDFLIDLFNLEAKYSGNARQVLMVIVKAYFEQGAQGVINYKAGQQLAYRQAPGLVLQNMSALSALNVSTSEDGKDNLSLFERMFKNSIDNYLRHIQEEKLDLAQISVDNKDELARIEMQLQRLSGLAKDTALKNTLLSGGPDELIALRCSGSDSKIRASGIGLLKKRQALLQENVLEEANNLVNQILGLEKLSPEWQEAKAQEILEQNRNRLAMIIAGLSEIKQRLQDKDNPKSLIIAEMIGIIKTLYALEDISAKPSSVITAEIGFDLKDTLKIGRYGAGGMGNCQNSTHPGNYNQGLMSFIGDAHELIIILRDENKEVTGFALMHGVYINDNDFAYVLERVYTNNNALTELQEKAAQAMAVKTAAVMGVKILLPDMEAGKVEVTIPESYVDRYLDSLEGSASAGRHNRAIAAQVIEPRKVTEAASSALTAFGKNKNIFLPLDEKELEQWAKRNFTINAYGSLEAKPAIQWTFWGSSLNEVEGIFKEIVSGTLADNIAKIYEAKQRPVYIMEWGAGNLAASIELANEIKRRGINASVIAFDNTYIKGMAGMDIPDNMKVIIDSHENLAQDLKQFVPEGELDFLISKDAIQYLLSPVEREDDFIVHLQSLSGFFSGHFQGIFNMMEGKTFLRPDFNRFELFKSKRAEVEKLFQNVEEQASARRVKGEYGMDSWHEQLLVRLSAPLQARPSLKAGRDEKSSSALDIKFPKVEAEYILDPSIMGPSGGKGKNTFESQIRNLLQEKNKLRFSDKAQQFVNDMLYKNFQREVSGGYTLEFLLMEAFQNSFDSFQSFYNGQEMPIEKPDNMAIKFSVQQKGNMAVFTITDIGAGKFAADTKYKRSKATAHNSYGVYSDFFGRVGVGEKMISVAAEVLSGKFRTGYVENSLFKGSEPVDSLERGYMVELMLPLSDLQLIGDAEKGASGSSALAGGNIGKEAELGGIDFRSLPIVTEAVAGLSKALAPEEIGRLAQLDLDSEWREIENANASGVDLSPQRIGEYIQAACARDCLGQEKDNVVMLIADILRRQEENGLQTEQLLKDILVVMESLRRPEELKQVFLGEGAV